MGPNPISIGKASVSAAQISTTTSESSPDVAATATLARRPREHGALLGGLSTPQKVRLLSKLPPEDRLVYIGDGPRTGEGYSEQVNEGQRRESDFTTNIAMGANYRGMQTVIIAPSTTEQLGRGNHAWDEGQGGGTANTGIESIGVDLRPRIENYMLTHREGIVERLEGNPVGQSIFDSSFNGYDAPGGGRPALGRASMTRAELGREANENVIHQMGNDAVLPFNQTIVLTNARATTLSIRNPKEPGVEVVDSESRHPLGAFSANAVRVNTGTMTSNPIRDPEVQKRTYSGGMSSENVNRKLDEFELLDEDGMLSGDARVASLGASLSHYDQDIGLNFAMKQLQPSASSITGYEVTQEARTKYADSLISISFTPGKWVPPRHTDGSGARWSQKTDHLVTSEMLHAASLHEHGQQVFEAVHRLGQASVAIANGMTPQQLKMPDATTFEVVTAMHEGNLKHVRCMEEAKELEGDAKFEKLGESAQTQWGAERQHSAQALMGLCGERDLGEGVQRMRSKAPLTWVFGYSNSRSQVNAVSQLRDGELPDNAEHFQRHAEAISIIAASPVRVHDLAYQLMDAGILRHVAGKYDDIKPNPGEGKSLKFTGSDGEKVELDAVFVSPTFDPLKDAPTQSLAGQSRAVHPRVPNQPVVTRNRQVVTKNGELSNVELFGLAGGGAKVPGTRSTVGAFAWDVNNRESATDVAKGLALKRYAFSHLKAAGVPDPDKTLDQFYEQVMVPDRSDYRRETASFEPMFDDLMGRDVLVRIAGELARPDDPATYARNVEQLLHGQVPDAPTGAPADVRARYDGLRARIRTALDQRPDFAPAPLETWVKHRVDPTIDQHEAVYKLALAKSREVLAARNPESSSSATVPADFQGA